MRRPFCIRRWVRRQSLRVIKAYDDYRLYVPKHGPACLGSLVYALSRSYSHPKFTELDLDARTALVEQELLWLQQAGYIKYAEGDYPPDLYWTLTTMLERLALA